VNSLGECQAAAEAADRHFFTYRSDRVPPQCRVPAGADDAEDTLNCLTNPRVPGNGDWSIYRQICPDPTFEPTSSPSLHPSMEPTMKAPTMDPTTIEDAPCKNWCKNPRDQFEKDQYCNFPGCRGCDECWKPTLEPTAPIPGCASWCASHHKTWDEKCPQFIECRECPACDGPLCSPWCSTHDHRWRVKCDYLHCSACNECVNSQRLTEGLLH